MIVIFLAATMLNQAVTPETLSTTICQPGYAATYRRSHPVKLATRKGYVRDHIVPIELGGSSDPSNIQYQTREDSHHKDLLEGDLHRDVCDGWIHLKNAQRQMQEWKP